VYNTDVVRQLCREITARKTLTMLKNSFTLAGCDKRRQEEIRTRMYFLAKKFADVISDSKAAD